MKNKDMMTITTLPNGNTVYSLAAYTGKFDAIVSSFFGPRFAQNHKILLNACKDRLNSMSEAESTYNALVKHSGKLFSPFMFLWNYHNFVAFLQQYKIELEGIGITSFLPMRELSAARTHIIEFDANGVYVDTPKKRTRRTHDDDTSSRLLDQNVNRRSEYYEKWIVTDKKCLNDDTIVVRTKYGTAPVMFFNIVSGDINVPETLTSTKDVKAYEIDRLKTIYAKINNINYMDVRPISYANWKTLPLTKKIATQVADVDSTTANEIFRQMKFAM